MVMSGDQNAGRSCGMNIDNNYFERVEHFRYLGTNLTHQNSIQKGNKCRLLSLGAEPFVFQFTIQEYKD
jgi:hypothetical protein